MTLVIPAVIATLTGVRPPNFAAPLTAVLAILAALLIAGRLFILLGEAAITASGWLLLWFAIFFMLGATNIRLWEEPHLTRRFGDEYVLYRQRVPRWIPRVSAWEQPVQQRHP
jgi:protein-S-isoprenylcysteine O-methyltransferase Ste14